MSHPRRPRPADRPFRPPSTEQSELSDHSSFFGGGGGLTD